MTKYIIYYNTTSEIVTGNDIADDSFDPSTVPLPGSDTWIEIDAAQQTQYEGETDDGTRSYQVTINPATKVFTRGAAIPATEDFQTQIDRINEYLIMLDDRVTNVEG